MERRNGHHFQNEKMLMETFLSQSSGAEVYSSDMLFMQRTFADPENYENKQYLGNSYSHDETAVSDKHYRCDMSDNTYVRDNGQFYTSFGSEREEQRNELPRTFTAPTGFDDVASEPLNDVHYVNQKIDQPSLRITLEDEAPQLVYEGNVNEKLEDQYSSNASVSRSSSEERLSSSCPLLVQESSYSAGTKVLNDDHSDSSCPVLIQEVSCLQVDSSHMDSNHSQPSTSAAVRKWNGENPLRRFSVLVGNKKLNFRVCDRTSLNYSSIKGTIPEAYALSDNVIFKGNKCFVCGRTFPTKLRLREHQMSHTGAKPKSCPFCGRIFYNKNSLQIHERIHTGEKPFQCPICTKCFARQTNYNIHMKLHASGRRYFCSFCGKWFRTESDMLDHQLQCLARMQGVAVRTERPLRYQCSYCEKMFHHRRDKNIHERTHTGERPYSCGYCGKGFTQSQALTIHIRTHTGERPYNCAICSKDFRDSSALRKHEFIKHTTMRVTNPTFSTLNDMVLMSMPTLPDSESLHISE